MRDMLKIQLIFFSTLLVILPIAAQVFAIAPLRQHRSTQSQTIIAHQQKNDRILQDIEKLIGQYRRDQLEADLALIDGALSDKRTPVEFISTVEHLGQEAGIEPALTFEQEVDPDLPELQSLPLTIRAQGTYEKLMPFLRSLEQQPFYLSFDEVTLQPLTEGSDGEGSPILQLLAHGQTTWK